MASKKKYVGLGVSSVSVSGARELVVLGAKCWGVDPKQILAAVYRENGSSRKPLVVIIRDGRKHVFSPEEVSAILLGRQPSLMQAIRDREADLQRLRGLIPSEDSLGEDDDSNLVPGARIPPKRGRR